MTAVRSAAKHNVATKSLHDRIASLEGEINGKDKTIASLTNQLQQKEMMRASTPKFGGGGGGGAFDTPHSPQRHNNSSSMQLLERQILKLESEVRTLQSTRADHSETFLAISMHQQKVAELEATLERETRLRSVLQNQLKEVHVVHERETQRIRQEIDKMRLENSETREKRDELRTKLQQCATERDEFASKLMEAQHEIQRLEGDLQRMSDHAHKCRDEANSWITDAKKQFEVQHTALVQERDSLIEARRSAASLEDYAALEQHRMQRLKDDLQDAKDMIVSLEQENASLRHRLENVDHQPHQSHRHHSVSQAYEDTRGSSVASQYLNDDDVAAPLNKVALKKLEAENRSLSQSLEMLTERLSTQNYSSRIGDLMAFDDSLQSISNSIHAETEAFEIHLGNVEAQFEFIKHTMLQVMQIDDTIHNRCIAPHHRGGGSSFNNSSTQQHDTRKFHF
eukprot:PhF_6_TR21202/c0_g1_i1/m.30605